MEEIKKQIIELLWKSADKVHSAGSCGELGDSFQALDSDLFPDVALEIMNLMQIIFDTENQPNQLGIKSPFEGDKSDFNKAVHNLNKEVPD